MMLATSEFDHFLRESQSFADFDTMATPQNAVERMRAWLHRAPTLATPEVMNIWGGVLHQFMLTFARYPYEPAKDAALLGSYFDAMTQLEQDEWWTERDNGIRAYDAFRNVLGLLTSDNSSLNHILMDALLDAQWRPHLFLSALHGIQERELTNMGAQAIDWDLYTGSSVKGLFLRAGWVKLEDGWRPPDNDMFGQIWLSVKGRITVSNHSRIEALRQAMPGQMPRMLTAVLLSIHLTADDISQLFPLRPAELAACDAHAFMHALVGLLTDGGQDDPTYKARTVGKLLEQHHPQLATLMALHLSLVPQACETRTYAEMVVPGFEVLRGNMLVQNMIVSEELFADGPAA